MIEWIFTLYLLSADGTPIADVNRFPTQAECERVQQEFSTVCGGHVTPCKPVQK